MTSRITLPSSFCPSDEIQFSPNVIHNDCKPIQICMVQILKDGGAIFE